MAYLNNFSNIRKIMELDSTDRKIAHQFDTDASISRARFAKKLRITRQALDYRIKKLVEKGVIKKFHIVVNFSALGYWQYKVYSKLKSLRPEDEKKMLDFLTKMDRIMWIAKCRGRFDLAYSVMIKSPAEFAELQNKVYGNFGANIQKRDMLITEHSLVFIKPFIEGEKEKKEFAYGGLTLGRLELDEKDRSILVACAERGLASVYEIAEKTCLGPDTVHYRLKKMKNSGLIAGVKAEIDLKKTGFLLYKIIISLNSYSPDLFKKIEAFSRSRKHIVQYLKLIGPWDIEIEYQVRSADQLQDELALLRNEFASSIRDYEVLEVYDESKFTFFPFRK